MPKFYTLRKAVPVADGQIVKFTRGKGYYADFPNPSVFHGHTPPAHVPPLAPHVLPPAPSKADRMVAWAHWGLDEQAHYLYTQSSLRSEMFDSKPGVIPADGNLRADCSQFFSACEHWAGGTVCNDRDWTGTLLKKGKLIADHTLWLPSFGVIWGGGDGEHIAMLTERNGATDWWTIGFGHSPGAPNRVALSVMTAWMINHGHPGVRVLSFL